MNLVHDPGNGGPRLELVGTIEAPGQKRSSMSWSSDGRFLATSTSEHVSVWRLPAKDLNHANMNIDASLTTSEEVETKKVEIDRRGFYVSSCMLYALKERYRKLTRAEQIIQYKRVINYCRFAASAYGHHFI